MIIVLLALALLSGIAAADKRGPWSGFGFVLISIFAIVSATLVHLFGR